MQLRHKTRIPSEIGNLQGLSPRIGMPFSLQNIVFIDVSDVRGKDLQILKLFRNATPREKSGACSCYLLNICIYDVHAPAGYKYHWVIVIWSVTNIDREGRRRKKRINKSTCFSGIQKLQSLQCCSKVSNVPQVYSQIKNIFFYQTDKGFRIKIQVLHADPYVNYREKLQHLFSPYFSANQFLNLVCCMLPFKKIEIDVQRIFN